MSGRPVSYKQLLDTAQHAVGFVWQVEGAEHITVRIEPSSSGFWAIWRHDLESNPWWDGSQWQTETRYVHDIFRWKLEDAVQAVQPLLALERANAARNAAAWKERAERAKTLADAVDEFLEPVRKAVAS